ncbi:MAG: hypothetical protein D6738_03015 [Acidobacteria bacterium]|nr:MAG: hypothetical protein D6738_03015 [Acidobacteriota bacterium]
MIGNDPLFDELADAAPGAAWRLPLRRRLAVDLPLTAVELRPPRRDLAGDRAMDAWIDVYHAVRGFARRDTVVFLTDNAIGTGEEENVAHLVKNLGPDAPRGRIVPFLTLKHSLDYCLRFAARVQAERFPALVVLGGDAHDGVPRCLPRAWMLRERLRSACPGLLLGGWANPYRDPREQVGFLVEHADSLDFVLTQVVSHHDPGPVERFLAEVDRQRLRAPLLFGVFHYRSARRRTLETLARFIPVPRAEIERDFAERGLTAEQITARTVRWLAGLGVRRVYVSNLETGRAPERLARIATAAGTGPTR